MATSISVTFILGSLFVMILSSFQVTYCLSSLPDQEGYNNQSFIGCLPCSSEYIVGSYFHLQETLLHPALHKLVAKESVPTDLCEQMPSCIKFTGLSNLHWYLDGEGSHRRVVYTLKFRDLSIDMLHLVGHHYCEIVVVQKLPNGVFVDPFELQHLVKHGVFADAAAYGDTNLELPSVFCNGSIVEIHKSIVHDTTLTLPEISIELPLHARYQPLDPSGYSQVEIGRPGIFARCQQKGTQDNTCLWMLTSLDGGGVETISWQIPSGNEEHSNIVSLLTFLSALTCALSLVISALLFDPGNAIKYS